MFVDGGLLMMPRVLPNPPCRYGTLVLPAVGVGVSIAKAQRFLLERLGAVKTALVAVLLGLSTVPTWADGVDGEARNIVLVGAHHSPSSANASRASGTRYRARLPRRRPPSTPSTKDLRDARESLTETNTEFERLPSSHYRRRWWLVSRSRGCARSTSSSPWRPR